MELFGEERPSIIGYALMTIGKKRVTKKFLDLYAARYADGDDHRVLELVEYLVENKNLEIAPTSAFHVAVEKYVEDWGTAPRTTIRVKSPLRTNKPHYELGEDILERAIQKENERDQFTPWWYNFKHGINAALSRARKDEAVSRDTEPRKNESSNNHADQPATLAVFWRRLRGFLFS